MKNIFIRLCTAAAVYALLGCASAVAMGHRNQSGTQESGMQRKTVSVRGRIGVYGSEPHTFPGIVTDDGKQYSVQAPPDVLAGLYGEQGKKLVFTGTVVPREASGAPVLPFQTLRDGTFILERWEPVVR